MNFKQTPWKSDPRSKGFDHGLLFGATRIPETLKRIRGPVFNQGDSLRCTGYGTAANGFYIHGIPMNPDWSAAKIGQRQGRSVDINGGDPNMTMKHQRDDGFLPLSLAPNTLRSNGAEATNMEAWGTAFDHEAKKYDSITGYAKVTNSQMDYFDAIKNALTLNMRSDGSGAGVDAFSGWYQSWNERFVTDIRNLIGFHRYLFMDFCTIGQQEYLVAQNSYGEGFGDNGYQYFTRAVVNSEFALPHRTLKTLAALTKEQIAEMKKETILAQILRRFADLSFQFSERFGS